MKHANALVFGAERTGYGIEQVGNPVTVAELRQFLEDFDDDMIIILSHDSGYTYGTLSHYAEIQETEDGEEYETVDEVWMSQF